MEHQPPKLTNLMAHPILRKPLFPGQRIPLIIHNPRIIDQIHKQLENGTPYLGMFLRNDNGMVGDADAAAADPEIITHPSQLYEVGTLASIQEHSPIRSTGALQVGVL